MVCVMLHNLGIEKNDPCYPVDELDLIKRNVRRRENKTESRQIASKIAD